MTNSKQFAISLTIILSLARSPALAVPMMWGVDEQDGMLFSLDDYTTLTGLIEYGPLKWDDGWQDQDDRRRYRSLHPRRGRDGLPRARR